MIFKDNFSETHLLFSEPVQATLYQDQTRSIILGRFTIHLPTVRDLHFNEDLSFLLNILAKTVQDLKKEFSIENEFNSHLSFLSILSVVQHKIPAIAGFMYRLREGFKFICKELDFSDSITICGRPMNDEIFERIRDIVLVSSGVKNYSTNYAYMTPEQRAIEEKVQSIKNKGKKKDSNSSFEKTYMVLTYEFGYSNEEILNMTMYAVKTILKYTSKSINYKLTLLAKAYGNTKKVKFITDKGD